MSKPTYPAKYRERLVDLVRSGRSPESLSQEFEPCAATIRSWVKKPTWMTGDARTA